MASKFSFTRAMSTEEGVYGLILVSGIIAATASAGSPSWKTLLFTGITVVVFWAAHIYAGTVAMHGTPGAEGGPLGIRAAIAHAVTKARGMLVATVFPAVALLLGVVGILDDAAAAWVSLWVGVVVLACLGYWAYQRKGAPMLMRLVGALATASFGIAIVLAKAIVTH